MSSGPSAVGESRSAIILKNLLFSTSNTGRCSAGGGSGGGGGMASGGGRLAYH